MTKFIHLLYVPTMACNMQCHYCYLEDNTVDEGTGEDSLQTLQYAIAKFKEAEVVPFNISLHGGEVTTLPKQEFHDLIQYISDYYRENRELITGAGFKVGRPHIKTNLYGLDRHIETIREYNVSVSGSLDLPLSLHEKYRVTKGGSGTLEKILANIRLLSEIPNKKKVSATIFKEHFQYLDQIIEDIKFLDQNTCLDMNDFNFMIGFDYNSCGMLHHMSEEEQLAFYKKMHEAFDGTNLDAGVNGAWFDEFGPEYCTNCDNCGEKFFLLERNGDIYSCVRGQKNKDFYYGNIYTDSVEDILKCAMQKIFRSHNRQPFPEACAKCGYLYLCKTGCPFVKNVYHSGRSYTCLLQQQMYRDRNYSQDAYNDETVYEYVTKMRLEDPEKYMPVKQTNGYPSLEQIIAEDARLKYIYDSEVFILEVDGERYPLASQILRKSRDIVYLTPVSTVKIRMKKHLLQEECDYPENNALYIMILSGDLVTYGDEGRTKQRHIATHQIYKGVLNHAMENAIGNSKKYFKENTMDHAIENSVRKCDGNFLENPTENEDDYYVYDISNLIREYANEYSADTPNNMFFTTTELRDYHYQKQKNNAYYHIQAINLPFQNIEFYYLQGGTT